MHYRKYLVEFIGTFLLALVVSLSSVTGFSFGTPVMAGLTLGLVVYTLGGISGAHINPAVTLGLLSIKKIKTPEALYYVISQFIGAALARAATMGITGKELTFSSKGAVVIGVAEAIGAAVLISGVSAAVWKKVDASAQGLVIGGSLLVGASIASSAGNGIINPAVAFALGSFGPMYIIGPIIGTIGGAWLYRYLIGEKAR